MLRLMRRPPTLLLFDLDGTLVASSGTGRRALDRAFGELHGRADACAGFSLAGLTDRAIARRGLEAIGVTADDAAIKALLDGYLARLDDELKRASGYRVLDGVTAALARAAKAEGIVAGLGTGNLRAGAKRKLDHVALWHHFAFGGFADDSEQRPELIRIAAERGAEMVRMPLRSCRVIVIGDTTLDIAAARANGFDAFAVASGPVARAELEAAKPDALADTLADRGAIDWLLAARDGRPPLRRRS
ncbi:MAG: HAD family hydrolase [Planctomycetes bacterium]|nr:HAD family hydrolase [Planctomycetota bacterium]